jgi:hypothetical protein
MATLREYFDADFNYAVRVHVKLPAYEPDIDVIVLYDFSAYTAFIACYIPVSQYTLRDFLQLMEALKPGKTQFNLGDKTNLPSARLIPGRLEVRNNPFEIRVKFFGDAEWISSQQIRSSPRVFIYSESHLAEDEVMQLKQKGSDIGLQVQFRSTDHASERSQGETPLAFISHDSRDKAEVARKIAFNLQRMLCPVWYDEFSLSVGTNLRDSIESGLKKCKKCILVLSPNFFSNGGWTKKEFDSIFTREILEERELVLPVWYGVTKESVYDYSPSLLNVKGLDWNQLGEDDVCGQLYRAILDQ